MEKGKGKRETKMLRILFVVNGFAIGGGELKLLELISEMKRRYPKQYRIVVASVGQSGPLEEKFRKVADRTEIFFKRHAYDVTQIFGLIRLIQEERIQLIQTTLFYADILGTLAGILTGIRNVISWEVYTEQYTFKQKWAYRLASKGLSLIVAVSDATRKKMICEYHLPEAKVRTIHYGIDEKKFPSRNPNEIRKRLGIPKDVIVFGTIARLTEQKGHRYLVEAMPKIIKSFPRVVFLCIGDGPLRTSLIQLAQDRGVLSYIQFLGFQSDVPSLLSIMDVFVLPSLYEGFPNAVLEAMACGKPVVATCVDGTPEAVIHGETGFLVPSQNPEALAEALIRMARNPSLRKKMGKNGKRRIYEHFLLEHQISAFDQLYKEIANR